MVKKKAKLEMETLGKILLLTAFLIIFLLLFKGCKDQMENVGIVSANEYICWLSQTMKADLSFLFPSACQVIDVEQPQDEKGISLLMRKCWWMHGQGEKDIVPEGDLIKGKLISWEDVARTCYVFTPKGDILIKDFENLLRTHDKSWKQVAEDSKETTWAYIQKDSTEKTGICFDKRFEEDLKLQDGKLYFIIFYDDRSVISNGIRDRIMISRDPEFGKEQTGFGGSLGELKEKLKTWGGEILDIFREQNPFEAWDNDNCYSWAGVARIEAEKTEAKKFFDSMTEILQRCLKMAGEEACICDNSNLEPSNKLPKGFSIKIKEVEEKKYEIFLLDENKNVYKEEGEEFKKVIKGGRLGLWDLRKNEIIQPAKCFPGVKKEYTLTSILADYYLVYHPNKEGRFCEGKLIETKDDYSALYLVHEGLTGIKKCSELR